jgi:hypothetical protein
VYVALEVLMSPSLVPSPDHDLHFVLCDFGKYGKSYIETDPSEADRDTIVRNMIDGQYNHPLRVIALNPAEGWSRDVSEEIAKAVVTAAEADDRVLTAGTSAFVETQRLRTLARLVDDSTKKGLVDPQRN